MSWAIRCASIYSSCSRRLGNQSRIYELRAQTHQEAIACREIGCPAAATIEDQQLMFDKDALSDDRRRAARSK